ncbi:MAG: sigma-54 dependent transcriptional regulator [Myxococcota bacterium]|nr:sigma-54 dependent transcriptional regulator [Myxococcota bacterium]
MQGSASAHMSILVADDESSIRFVIREALETDGHAVTEVDDGDSAIQMLLASHFDLAFIDIRMPGQTGLEVLDQVRAMGCATPIVIITAQNTMDNAVEAMKMGALDYLTKPFSLAQVAALAERTQKVRSLQNEVDELRRESGHEPSPLGQKLIGNSPAMLDIFKTVGKVAVRNVPVLIVGESGTGKELVARAIHSASTRSEKPFVAVNAAAIPGELLESELFGHERGAFTGAVSPRLGRFREASGGTLFLDEIGDMPIALQAKLLRALQSGEVIPVGGRDPIHVDVRVVTATHRNLDEAVEDGHFREDLLYRLRVVPIEVPSLRERKDDIRILAEHFVRRYGLELSEAEMTLADPAIADLESYDWPGNVRELENAIKRALVLASTSVLGPEDFAFLTQSRSPSEDAGQSLDSLIKTRVEMALDQDDTGELHSQILAAVEKPLVATVLAHTDGNQIRAAALLGINRNTLRKKIAELGLVLPTRNEHE